MGPVPDFDPFEQRLFEGKKLAFCCMGMREDEAEDLAREGVETAIQASKAAGLYNVGPLGERMLSVSKSGRNKETWEAKSRDGVQDADILEWWDLNDVERQLMLMTDDGSKMGLVIERLQRGDSMEQAIALGKKSFPVFGDNMDTSVLTGDDRPLPWELKLRQIRWCEKIRAEGGDKEFKELSQQFSSMNAFIRQMIREGRF